MGNNSSFLDAYIHCVGKGRCYKRFGKCTLFLGIEIQSTSVGLLISHGKFAYDILTQAEMFGCKPICTPLVAKFKYAQHFVSFPNLKFCHNLVGALQYLTITWPDLSYVVNPISQYMHAPTLIHIQLVKRILHHVCGNLDHGIFIHCHNSLDLYAFPDGNWVGCLITRWYIIRFCVFLGYTLVSWTTNKQLIVARSSIEAEYRSMVAAIVELTWLSFLLQDIGMSP